MDDAWTETRGETKRNRLRQPIRYQHQQQTTTTSSKAAQKSFHTTIRT